MKAIDPIKNWFKNISAMKWMWLGFFMIGTSTVLSTIAIYHPSNLLSTVAQVLAGFGIILSIAQAYRSARDFKQEQKRTDAVARTDSINSTKLRIESNLNQAPDSMPTKASQVIHRRNDAME